MISPTTRLEMQPDIPPVIHVKDNLKKTLFFSKIEKIFLNQRN